MQEDMMRKWAQHERPGYLINRAARLLLRLADIRFRPLGLGVASFPVLSMLRTGQKLSQKDLALCARIEQPSMAQLLSRLERDGMIKRTPDPADGRSSLISITRKAQGILPEVDAAGWALGNWGNHSRPVASRPAEHVRARARPEARRRDINPYADCPDVV